MIQLNPYLNFMGKTKEVMEFYHSIFGGKLTMQTYQEGGMSQNPSEANLIMHSELRTDTLMFMAADGNEKYPVSMGNNIQMSLSGNEEGTLTKYFNALAVGGTVNQPLTKAPWGDTFGMLTDKYGIRWLVDIGMVKK